MSPLQLSYTGMKTLDYLTRYRGNMKTIRPKHKFKAETSILDLEAAIQHLRETVPKKYWGKINIDFEVYEEYGTQGVDVDVYYTRPNTAEEDEVELSLQAKRKDVELTRLKARIAALEG